MNRVGKLTLIGYWADPTKPTQWPSPAQFVDHNWNQDERDMVAMYLENGIVARGYMGFSPCRVCGCDNGNLELTDGHFVWPEGFSHYLADHGVRPPQAFIDHVLSMMESVEHAGRDESWWRSSADPIAR